MLPSDGGDDSDSGGFLGNQAGEVEGDRKTIDGLSQAGDFATAAGIADRGGQAYAAIQPFGGTYWDAFENGSHDVDETGFGSTLGSVGTGLNAASTFLGGLQVADDISKKGADAYHDQKTYDDTASTLVAGAQTLLPYAGPYGEAASLAITGASAATDLAGGATGWAFGDQAGFTASSVEGDILRGTFGDKSLGDKARQAVTGAVGDNALGNGLGVAADIATNVVAAPENLANTAITGAVNELGAVGSGLADGKGAVGGAVQSTLNGAGKVVDGAKGAVTGAKNTVTKTLSKIHSW